LCGLTWSPETDSTSTARRQQQQNKTTAKPGQMKGRIWLAIRIIKNESQIERKRKSVHMSKTSAQ
jgi:hypothetical protein